MQKNDVVKVTIEDIGVNGEGIGKNDGYTPVSYTHLTLPTILRV